MSVLQWLRRAVRRFNRAAEETALAASVVQTDAGAQTNAMGTKAVLGEIEKDERDAQE